MESKFKATSTDSSSGAFIVNNGNPQNLLLKGAFSVPIGNPYYMLPAYARHLSISADHTKSAAPSNDVYYSLSRSTKPKTRIPIGNLTLPLRTGSEPPLGRRRPAVMPIDLPPHPHGRGPAAAAASAAASPPISSGAQFSPEDIDRRYAEMLRKSGRLTFDCNQTAVSCQRDDLHFEYELGQGICGVVSKATHRPSGRAMAVKVMRRIGNSPEENRRVIMDLEVVAKCHDCRHIVRYYGLLLLPSEVWICMELMTTCLERLVRCLGEGLPERVLGKVLVPILRALHYLKERHNIMHRDVKPSNFLIDRGGRVKLCDFGISGLLENSKAKTRTAGCTAYLSPERITLSAPYDIRSDVWSLGVSLVELATGSHPLAACSTEMEMLTRIVDDPPPRLPPLGFSDHFSDFVAKCLTKEVARRPKYQRLLCHDFVKYHEQTQTDLAEWLSELVSLHPSIDADPGAQAASAGADRADARQRRRLSQASSQGSGSSGYGSVDAVSPASAQSR